MKKLFAPLLAAVALVLLATTGCNKTTLQPGGAYAPTNSVGAQVIAPDVAFYQIEAGFKFAHQTIMTAFELEYDNRALLWKLAPDIKQGLDNIRPGFNEGVLEYSKARDAYRANPTPVNLKGMDFWLAKLKQLASTAEAISVSIGAK